jgi:hypothetical protein
MIRFYEILKARDYLEELIARAGKIREQTLK